MPRTHLSPRDLALTLAVTALWGFMFVPIKWALVEIPPFALAALRFVAAALPAMLFIPRPAMPWRDVAAYGLAIGFFQFGLLFLGMKLGMPAGLSSLVIQLQVFFTIALAVMFTGDRLTRANLAGAAVAGLGIVVLAIHKLDAGMTATFTGFLLVVAAAFAWGVGNVMAKRSAKSHGADNMFALVVWSSIVPPIPLAIASYLFEGGAGVWAAVTHASWLAWGCVLFMAWGATLFCFGSWNGLLHRYPAALIAPFALLIPVAGIASGWLFLGESLAPLQMAGVALVFGGLAINVIASRSGPA